MIARYTALPLILAVGLTSAESAEFFGLRHSDLAFFIPSEVSGVSADGRVLTGAHSIPPNCPPNADCFALPEAFRWSPDDGFEPIRPPGFPASSLWRSDDISEDGQTLAVYGRLPSQPGNEPRRSFLWTPESGLMDFGSTGEGRNMQVAVAWDLSADGSVAVGSFGSGMHCEWCGGDFEAFRWTAETGIELLGDLPGGGFRSLAKAVSHDGSVIAGTGTSLGGVDQAFRWSEETGIVGLGFLESRILTTATGISPSGDTIIGFADGLRKSEIAFRWTEEDGLQALGEGIPTGISADGTIVGNSENNGPFVWRESDGRWHVWTVLARDFGLASSLVGWELESIGAISSDGTTLVGMGRNPDGVQDVWIARRTPGDYNGDDAVDQADLDLALMSWGADGTSVPDIWTTNLPSGIVDQGELDAVLGNWGRAPLLLSHGSVTAVPEAPAAVLLLFCLVAALSHSLVAWPERECG